MNRTTRVLSRFWADERGSTYMINYIMVIPIIMIFLTVTLETVFLFHSIMGVDYASHFAARAASVWYHPGGSAAAQRKAEQAARQAMFAFANGMHQAQGAGNGPAPLEEEWIVYAQENGKSGLIEPYLRRKYRYASSHLEVQIDKQAPTDPQIPWIYEFEVRTTYQYRFHIPIVARLLGYSSQSIPITRTVLVANEAPRNDSESLGVPYGN